MSRSTPELPSAENLHAGSRLLSIDIDEQRYLVQSVISTAEAIRRSPIKPDLTELQLYSDRAGSKDQGVEAVKLNVNTDSIQGLEDTTISIISRRPSKSMRYHSAPMLNVWEILRPINEDAPFISNLGLTEKLSEQLGDAEMFESLADRGITTHEITVLMRRYMRKQSPRQTRIETFTDSGILTGEPDYISNIDTRLVYGREGRDRRSYKLSIAALYSYGVHELQKNYKYEIETSHRGVESAGGTVSVWGNRLVAKERLDTFADLATLGDWPLKSLHIGLDNLRHHYPVTDPDQPAKKSRLD